jgi:hypothetical protein
MTPKLHVKNRPTAAYYLLHTASITAEGIKPEGGTKQRRSNEYNTLENMKAAGWLFVDFTGPRGGARYRITLAGAYALCSSQQEVEAARLREAA